MKRSELLKTNRLKFGISATVAVVIVVIILVAIIVAAYVLLAGTSSTKSGPTTYTLGVVFPLTGTLASFGKSFVNAVKLAVQQMNANLTAAGNPIRFTTSVADDQGTASGALNAVTQIYSSTSAQVIIGPLTTAEVLGVRDFVDTNHIVLLPPASSGTAAALPGDYVTRPGQPGDQFEGSALGQTIVQLGMKNVVYLYRSDTSQNGTFHIASGVMNKSGVKATGIVYTPDQSDYSSEASLASSDVSNIISSGGTYATTGVVLGGFGTEASNIFTHASTDPYLSKVRWFGIEALNDNTLLNNSITGQFMTHVNLTITTLYTQNSPQGQNFVSDFTAVYGSPPEPFSNYAYDVTWIAMLSVLVAGSYSGSSVLAAVPIVADHFFGAVGTGTYLDANGDQAIAFFAIDKAVLNGTIATFTQIGTYNGGVNQVTLSST